MSKALYIPNADRSQWFADQFDGRIFTDLDKILLHSTETTGWPGYGGGGSGPTLTINPWTRQIRQHFPLNESARALLNPASTSVSENKDNVCQIEVIGYSDAAKARSIGRSDRDLRNLKDTDLKWIAGILVFIMKEWTVPNVWATPFPWPSYPASYGNTASRMSSAEYDKFAGILAHLHASGNDHGDLTIDTVKLKKFVTELLTPKEPTVATPTRRYVGNTQAAKDAVHAFLSSDAFDAPDGASTNPFWSGSSWTKYVGRWTRATYLETVGLKAKVDGLVADVKAIRALLEKETTP